MFDIFKKKNKSAKESVPQNDFLSNENAAFNTTSSSDDSFKDTTDCKSLVYQEPVYDVPKYKASNLSNIGVVVNSTDIGLDRNSLNPNIKTIDIPSDEQKELDMAIENSPLVEETPIELIDVSEPTKEEMAVPDVFTPEPKDNAEVENKIYKSSTNDRDILKGNNKNNAAVNISIFGSSDGITNKNNYTSSNQFEEQKQELIKEVEYTSDGNKICPNCGAILKPDAPVCFMCSKSFILKK